MDFFDKLTKKAKQTYEGASKKTGELAKEAKLRMKMNENKSEINSLYQEIGKKVYEKHTLSEEINIKIDLEEECTKIDILSSEIETCLNQIRELKDKKQCPKCFNEIDLDAKFCNHCGAKQEDMVAHEVEVIQSDNTNEKSEKNVAIVEEKEQFDTTSAEVTQPVSSEEETSKNKTETSEVPANNDDAQNNQN